MTCHQRTCRVLVCSILLIYTVCASKHQHWSYHPGSEYGPDNWMQHYPLCGQGNQSPIDIVDSVTTETDQLPPLEFVNYITQIPKVKLWNNGHTLKVELPTEVELRLRGATLRNWYLLSQLHFHWGMHDKEGSEHFLNGEQYPLEIHFVHQHMDKGAKKEPTYAVLGALCQISEDNNTALEQIFENLVDVSYKGQGAVIHNNLSISGLLPEDKSNYYHFLGSLTTPPCSFPVSWTILQDHCNVSSYQLKQFRTLLQTTEKDGIRSKRRLMKNFRPTQALNGRNIFRISSQSKESIVTTSIKDVQVTVTTAAPSNDTISDMTTDPCRAYLIKSSAFSFIAALLILFCLQ